MKRRELITFKTPKDLGTELKRRRTAIHLTQQALAGYASVSNGAISWIESARGGALADTINKIDEALSVLENIHPSNTEGTSILSNEPAQSQIAEVTKVDYWRMSYSHKVTVRLPGSFELEAFDVTSYRECVDGKPEGLFIFDIVNSVGSHVREDSPLYIVIERAVKTYHRERVESQHKYQSRTHNGD